MMVFAPARIGCSINFPPLDVTIYRTLNVFLLETFLISLLKLKSGQGAKLNRKCGC